jgi:hypothetical protein
MELVFSLRSNLIFLLQISQNINLRNRTDFEEYSDRFSTDADFKVGSK